VRLIHWDLATDTITPGQWLAGRIYNERCDLSPDGKLLVYFAGKFKTKLGTFTAVSRPPYFTALALWPDGSTWGGGGFFESNRKLVIKYGRVIDELNDHENIPDDFEITHLRDFEGRFPGPQPLASQGWTLTRVGSDSEYDGDAPMKVVYEEPWLSEKKNPTRPRLVLEQSWLGMFEVNGPCCVYSYRLMERPKSKGEDAIEELGRLDWADWDHNGDLLYSHDGKLFRRHMSRHLNAQQFEPIELADFTGDKFTNILPSEEAKQWP
jgi:hypothetical protein